MRFDLEKIFEDYALVCECATTQQELVEETTHHPVSAALEAAKLVKSGISTIDAAIKLYQDDWYGYREYGMRFAHFHALVCAVVNGQAEEVLEREHSLYDKVCLALLTNNVGCVIHWVEIASNGRHATAGYTNPAGTKYLQLLIDIEYICEIPAFIGIWGVDDNGGKGIFRGTLLL